MLIYIVGFMGAGKTTFGKRLAKAKDYTFIDLDELIEQLNQTTIPDIFNKGGEDYFRVLEHNALIKTLSYTDTIIACGGGTPCFFNNMDMMLKAGKVVYLNVEKTVLVKRLSKNAKSRPLIKGLKNGEFETFIDINLKLREPYYVKSSITLTTSEVANLDLSTIFS